MCNKNEAPPYLSFTDEAQELKNSKISKIGEKYHNQCVLKMSNNPKML